MPATAITPTAVGNKTPVSLPAPASGTAADATNGNSVANGGSTLLLIYNSGASTRTVTVAFTTTVDGQAVTPLGPFNLSATTEYALMLGSPSYYGNPTIITANNTEVKLRVLALP
jgi:hypothetical protein